MKQNTKQWLWFIALWCLGLLTVGLISLMIKGIVALGQ